MPAKKHRVTLTTEARRELERAARSNKRFRRERQRARILLAAGDGGIVLSVGRAQANACALTLTRRTLVGTRRLFQFQTGFFAEGNKVFFSLA